ncbi:hypothetical protein QYE76_010240 [Lolium multiflorum]|uniref:Cytochrome c oxidase assembly factor 3 mitochondrial coiled-coil domain-containing protein n=1 Tax=Lolium multiflorum TaxID=4521 RepID=A0AAD8X1P1_LOLMU|nr:hypothetical protein QYE76_010240 [Lolium multiflorum]
MTLANSKLDELNELAMWDGLTIQLRESTLAQGRPATSPATPTRSNDRAPAAAPSTQKRRVELLEMAGGFSALGPKTKNLVVAGGLTGFVLGVYYYTMHAVGGTDELQVAIDKFEDLKKKDAAESAAAAATKPSAPGSS